MEFKRITKIPKWTKQFIEDYIDLIDSNKIEEVLQTAIVEAELSEESFKALCETLEEIDLPAFEERNKLFIDLFDQYMEVNESDYEQNDADRLVEMMDTMSTAICLGLEFDEIIALLNQWDKDHPGHIAIEGNNLNELKIRFLIGNSNE